MPPLGNGGTVPPFRKGGLGGIGVKLRLRIFKPRRGDMFIESMLTTNQ